MWPKKLAIPALLFIFSFSISFFESGELGGARAAGRDMFRMAAGPRVDGSLWGQEAPPPIDNPVYLPLVLNGNGSGGVFPGYNLFAPTNSTTTYLVDNEGNIVHSWASDTTPGKSAYLHTNGNLVRAGYTGSTTFGAGAGGVVEVIRWDGKVYGSFFYADNYVHQHHDIEITPNDTVFMIAWERKLYSESLAAGRNPYLMRVSEGLWPDHIIEVDGTSGAIIWEWHVWDHLIQDYDPSKANYGVVGDHPELVDLNYYSGSAAMGSPDWVHMNSIDYNAELDQILVSVLRFDEIWVIDHSTTITQAAGHSGGNSGRGGDLLYRWGNPQAYRMGTAADQQLFLQHDARWIPSGCPGAGNILVFNNGLYRPGEDYSSVEEITPPLSAAGNYMLEPGSAYGPAAPVWSYTAPDPGDFFTSHMGGAQRLPNGNTLITDSTHSSAFEVTPSKEIVWSYNFGDTMFWVTRYSLDYPGLPPDP
jgi:hypothetical protein